ncbi:MAG: cupin domain-containing protein, partial [Verrucomicrobia bacterium]|nr:cupin domain-containing protein [Verrucomicrobiota bacterium]
YHSGISRQTAGSKGICMHILHLPPGAVEKAHLHRDHETAIYMISGSAELRYGEHLEEHEVIHAGEFLYISPNTPHLPRNASETEECVVVIARTDPNEQESVVLLPELEKLVPDWSGTGP